MRNPRRHLTRALCKAALLSALLGSLAVSFPARAVVPGCGDGSPVIIKNFVRSNSPTQGVVIQFDISGGNAGVWYDILTTTNISRSRTDWAHLGQGRPCDTVRFTNQPVAGAFYALLLPNAQNSGAVYLTNLLCIASPDLGTSVKFDLAGGETNVLYTFLTSTNFTPAPGGISDWTWIGQGVARKSYSYNFQMDPKSFFAVGAAPGSFVVAWGNNDHGQCNVPPGLTNAVAVTGGAGFSVALRADGRVVAWGDNSCGQTNVPAGLNYVTAIAAGSCHSLALRADGTLATWGMWKVDAALLPAQLPVGLSNVVAIAAGLDHDVALKADGSIVTWGANTNDPFNNVPTNLPPAAAITAGWNHNVLLQSNGVVRAWGINGANLGWNLTNVPPGLGGTVSLAAGPLHTVAVRGNGTVVAWGYNADGQTNVPPGLSNVVRVAAGEKFSMALRHDGSLTVWGSASVPSLLSWPPGLSGVTAIGAGENHCLAIGTSRSPPLLLHQPAGQSQVITGTAMFDASALSVGALAYQWQFNGTNIAGETNTTLVLTNLQLSAQGNYRVIIKNAAGTITTSNASLALLPLPPPDASIGSQPTNQWINSQGDLLLSVTVSDLPGAVPSVCTWRFNGTDLLPNQLSPYDYKIFGISAVDEGIYTALVSNASGSRTFNWTVHAASPGGIALWGNDDYGQSDRPAGLDSNVIAVAAGHSHSLALLADGTVRKWGYPWAPIPASLTNAIAISAGYSHSLALRDDGTVTAWGDTSNPANSVPTNLTGVVAIAAGWNHNLALLSNRTVTAWGVNGASLGWHLLEVPPGLTNVTAVAAGSLHSLALRANGSVVSWGYNGDGQTNVPTTLSNAVAIAAGEEHSLALRADGTVVAWGLNTSGQCNVPAGLNNVIAISAGGAHSVALKNDGSLVAWGDNSSGQASLGTNLANVKCLSAGGSHTLATVASGELYYPLDASKDLLVVCNTNSADSINVLNYYLAHRPMVATASVLNLSCATNETIVPENFTNDILGAFNNWLVANPTRRPSYVVLLLGVPSRVNPAGYSPDARPSVSYQISTGIPNWHPMVTHINMGDTNACFAYIDKLASMGATYSPGKLLISAGTGYGNTNYVVDNIRHGAGYPDDFSYCWWLGWNATNGLAENGVPSSGITWTNGFETFSGGVTNNLPHITNAANLAGYFSWGMHSSLGSQYAANAGVNCKWSGHSSWYILETVESFNGRRYSSGQGNFLQWFAPNAFGGSNYVNTPVGAVATVDEPGLGGVQDPRKYFGLWAAGRSFGICAWTSLNTPYFMAVGDPLVRR